MQFTSKSQLIETMRGLLSRVDNDKVKAEHYMKYRGNALLRIFENQTSDEQQAESTHHYNNMGFTGTDAKILSSFAKFYKRTGFLSPKQDAILQRKIVKYAGQLVNQSIDRGLIKKVNNVYVW
jgi:hypothetical protein